MLYAHNDSDDSARFFALSSTGELLATFVLAGVTAVDWEDAAVGPCDAGTSLFIGDIGDNAVKRKDYRLLKVPEPEPPAGVGATVGAPHERVDFSYADGEGKPSPSR